MSTWAVVAYEHGRPIKALHEGLGLWQSRNHQVAYDALAAAKNTHPGLAWGLVALYRGTEHNLMLELQK